MNRRQFAGVLGISGLSTAAYSLVGETSIAEASAADILKEEGFAEVSVDPSVLRYATTGALPFWVAGTAVHSWLRYLDFRSLPPELIAYYRQAGGAYRSFEGAESIWRTIPAAIRREGPDALRSFHSGKDWSHIVPRSAGGSDSANSGIFEKAALNRARGVAPMTGSEIESARLLLKTEAVHYIVRQAVGLTIVGALVPAVIEAIFAALEYGLYYQEGRITTKEFYLSVWRRFTTTAAAATVISGGIAGLAMVFPTFLPVLSALAVPAAAASFLLLGIRFYRLAREWLDRMGVDPAVEVWNRSKAISDWTRRAAAGAFDEVWGTVQDTSGRVWGATTGTLGRAWDATDGLSEPAWDSVSGTLVRTGDATQALSGRTWGTTTGALGRTWDATEGLSEPAWDMTQEFSGRVWGATTGALGEAKDAAQDASGRAWDAATGALGRAKDAVGEVIP